jgi:hypothetical protein
LVEEGVWKGGAGDVEEGVGVAEVHVKDGGPFVIGDGEGPAFGVEYFIVGVSLAKIFLRR